MVNKIVRLQRNFLWGCNEGDKKIAWVSWDSIRKLRKHGGLVVSESVVSDCSIIPNSLLIVKKFSLGRGLVKISAN